MSALAAGPHPHGPAPHARHQMPFAGRYRAYTLFGMTGVIYLLLGLLALDVVWALGDGRGRRGQRFTLESFKNPLYIAFHALSPGERDLRGRALLPPVSGIPAAANRPGRSRRRGPVILAMLYVAWIAVAGGLAVVLAGGIF